MTKKAISATAIAALMTASLGLATIAPAMAQDTNAQAPQAQHTKSGERNFRPGPGGPRGGADILGFERGAEAIEIAIVRLSHRLDLTADQQTLLETLKTDALSAAATFETATEGLRPTPPAEGQASEATTAETQAADMPSISQRFENRIALDKARLAAMESVQPAFTAFFDSLTDEQVAKLMPQQGERPDRPHSGKFGNRDGGPAGHGDRHDGQGQPPAPGGPGAAPAPDAPAPDAPPAPPADETPQG